MSQETKAKPFFVCETLLVDQKSNEAKENKSKSTNNETGKINLNVETIEKSKINNNNNEPGLETEQEEEMSDICVWTNPLLFENELNAGITKLSHFTTTDESKQEAIDGVKKIKKEREYRIIILFETEMITIEKPTIISLRVLCNQKVITSTTKKFYTNKKNNESERFEILFSGYFMKDDLISYEFETDFLIGIKLKSSKIELL